MEDSHLRAKLPLSWTQEMLFHLQTQKPNMSGLSIHHVAMVEGELDEDLLKTAFGEVVSGRQILRARYMMDKDGAPFMHIAEAIAPHFHLHDARGEDSARRAKTVAALLRAHVSTPLDLADGQLFRCLLIRVSEARWTIALTIHHISADGWSLSLILRDISRVYRDLLAGKPPTVKDGDFRRHVTRERRWLASQEAQGELDWWKEELRPLQRAISGESAARSAHGTVQLRRQIAVAPPSLLLRLRRAAGQHGVSVFVLAATAFKLLLAERSGCSQVILGTHAANRPTPASVNILGAHYNTSLLHIDSGDGHDEIRAQVEHVAQVCFGALQHQRIPAAIISEMSRREFGVDLLSKSRHTLVVTSHPLYDLRLPGAVVRELDLESAEPAVHPAQFPMARTRQRAGAGTHTVLTGLEAESGLYFLMDHDVSLYSESGVDDFLEAYVKLLDELVTELGQPSSSDESLLPPGIIRSCSPSSKLTGG